MSKILKKAFALIFAAAILAASVIPAQASIKPNYDDYKYGDAYMQSNYYEQLLEAKAKLTGDQRYDVILVALSQLGYHEGDCDADMDGWNLAGTGNYVEYNRLFCKLDGIWGYAWCAAFASWCQFQAGVPAEIDCSEVSCPRMINEILKPQGLYRTRESGYTPLPGDLIYFKNKSSNAVSTHVGIVIGVKDGFVYTVEGNGNENVGRHKYALDDTYIVGYGALKYQTKEGTDYSVFELEAEENKPGKYRVTASSLNVRSGIGTSYGIIGTLSSGDTVDVIEFKDGWGKIDYNGRDAWVSASYLQDASVDKWVYTVTFDANGGRFGVPHQRKFLGKELTLTEEIPTLVGHTFLGWATEKGGEVVYTAGGKYTEDAEATLYAVWEPLKLTVTFADYDGTVLATVEYDYGSEVTAPDITPTRETDGEFAYEFAGWDAGLSKYLKRDTTYTATYTARELTEQEKEAYLAAQATEEAGGEGCGAFAAFPIAAVAAAACLLIKKKEN